MRTYGSVRGAISDGRPYRDSNRLAGRKAGNAIQPVAFHAAG